VKRKSKKEPLQVTSFRLPPDVKTFLHAEAETKQRTMSWILVDIIRMYITYLEAQKKQPKTK
jgi:predicted DNA-binding protein